MKRYVIGDVHGHLTKLVSLLKKFQLIDQTHKWVGGLSELYLLGDLTDRGPDGIGVINFLMQLQQQALNHGGMVEVLLGNHDAALITAYRFPNKATSGPSGTFLGEWIRVGGNENELQQLDAHHINWLLDRPAIVQVKDKLLLHADTPMYLLYGSDIVDINRSFSDLLHGSDITALDVLRVRFREHHAFSKDVTKAQNILSMLRVNRMIHGHVPISTIRNTNASSVTEPFVYANGRCINVDGGMYLGGPGFVYELI